METATRNNKRKLEDDEPDVLTLLPLVRSVLPDVTEKQLTQAMAITHSQDAEEIIEYFLASKQKEESEDKNFALALQLEEELNGGKKPSITTDTPQQKQQRTKEGSRAGGSSEETTQAAGEFTDDASFALALQLQEEAATTTTQAIQRKPPTKGESGDDASFALAFKLQEEMNKTAETSMKACYVIPLEHGVVLFKHCLSMDQQIGLYHQCLEISQTQHNTMRSYNSLQNPMKTRKTGGIGYMMTINWTGSQKNQRVPLPVDLKTFAVNTFKQAQNNIRENDSFYADLPHTLKPPKSFNPEALHAILYPDGGSLHAHQDGVLGWVLSVSIGSSAAFSYSTHLDQDSQKMGNKQEIRLDSGDVVLFNGQALYHAIDKIIPNSAPSYWGKEMDDFGYARFNLQFRDLGN